ncbi:MAG TPA: serine/threonine protein kinase, partial [Rhodoglobus sp.]|nr:serine/threonine protein kinase [Rhodoglobus sp.]
VNIPDVVGQSQADGTTALQALQLNIRTQVDTSCTGGTVSRQSVVGEAPQRSNIVIGVCLP